MLEYSSMHWWTMVYHQLKQQGLFVDGHSCLELLISSLKLPPPFIFLWFFSHYVVLPHSMVFPKWKKRYHDDTTRLENFATSLLRRRPWTKLLLWILTVSNSSGADQWLLSFILYSVRRYGMDAKRFCMRKQPERKKNLVAIRCLQHLPDMWTKRFPIFFARRWNYWLQIGGGLWYATYGMEITKHDMAII